MTDNTKPYKARKRKSKGPFSDDLLDQLLAQLRGRDAGLLPVLRSICFAAYNVYRDSLREAGKDGVQRIV
ncbi:MAG: hypothetical protein IH606_18295 [Burkholderiales bacterium]|nr:hypothetical protein [Burkholderiales bacterium]